MFRTSWDRFSSLYGVEIYVIGYHFLYTFRTSSHGLVYLNSRWKCPNFPYTCLKLSNNLCINSTHLFFKKRCTLESEQFTIFNLQAILKTVGHNYELSTVINFTLLCPNHSGLVDVAHTWIFILFEHCPCNEITPSYHHLGFTKNKFKLRN
jgi:hypothetical protein